MNVACWAHCSVIAVVSKECVLEMVPEPPTQLWFMVFISDM